MRKGVGRYALGMVCLALLLATAACGHPAREHIRDWNKLFGARDEASQKNLAPLWEAADMAFTRKDYAAARELYKAVLMTNRLHKEEQESLSMKKSSPNLPVER